MRRLAANERIGVGVEIDPSAQFSGVEELEIGDHSYIGPNVRVIGGSFKVGEYSKIHNHSYIYSKSFVHLGNCAWIGQGVHLDGTGGIHSGDFLGVGINSALYSHVRHGDVTEGCLYNENRQISLGEDVWFVGMCLVGPITAESKSLALLGSVINTDMKANHIYGGNPARDLTAVLGPPWSSTDSDHKIRQLQEFLREYSSQAPDYFDRDSIVFQDDLPSRGDGRTFYSIKSRKYLKTNSKSEIAFNKWLFGFRAKFSPVEQRHRKLDGSCSEN